MKGRNFRSVTDTECGLVLRVAHLMFPNRDYAEGSMAYRPGDR